MAMAQTKRLAALLLALLLTLFLLPSAQADGGVVSGTTVSGTVRADHDRERTDAGDGQPV